MDGRNVRMRPNGPASAEPMATGPGATEPMATEPGAAEPSAGKPGATKPRPGGRYTAALLWVVPLVFFAVFFAWPVVNLLDTALRSDTGGWDLSQFADTLSNPRILEVIWFTVWQAAVSTVLTLVVALPGAWVLGHYRFPGRSGVEVLSVVAFVMPTVVVATAIGAALADDGPLGWLLPPDSGRGLSAIFAAHVYLNIAVVLRMVGSFWSQLDPRLPDAAAALGASPGKVLWHVTRPALAPVIWAASSIVFLFTLTSFGIVLLLGDFGQATVEVEIQRRVLFLFDLPTGAVLSVVQIAMVLTALVVQSKLSNRAAAEQDLTVDRTLPRPRTPGARLAVGTFLIVYLTMLLGPVLLVLERALRTAGGHGPDNFVSLGSSRAGSVLFVAPAEAVANSVVFAVAATIIATIVGLLVALALARRRESLRDSVWLLPLGVSAVTLGFGMLITFDGPPLPLRGTAALVPIAQALVAIPFVVRALLPVLRSIRGSIHESAAVLGASPLRTVWSIDLPIVARALAVAIGFSLAISLGEFGATVFLAPGDRPTVPIAIYRFLATPGQANVGQAMALSSILILLTAVAVLLTDRLRVGGRHV